MIQLQIVHLNANISEITISPVSRHAEYGSVFDVEQKFAVLVRNHVCRHVPDGRVHAQQPVAYVNIKY